MKRYYLFCLMAYLLSSSLIAQRTLIIEDGTIVGNHQKSFPHIYIEKSADGFIVSYEFEKIVINEDSFFPSSFFLELNEFEQIADDGKPSLPIKWDSYIVPQGKKAVVSIIDSSFVDVSLKIAPSRPNQAEWENRIAKPIQPYSGWFPQSNIIQTKRREYRGYELFDICLTPVKYDYQHESIRICKKLKYKITWTPDSEKRRNHTLPKATNRLVNTLSMRDYQNNDSIEDYLIITTPEFLQAAEKFAEWKRTLGFRMQIIAQETWTNTEVKTAITNIYNNLNYNLNYLLIIGDEDDVPPYKFVDYNNQHRLFFPVDLQYSCMGGIDDSEADIYMGRISVHNNAEAYNVVEKIINYENNPIEDDDFYNSALLSTYFQTNHSIDTEEWGRSYASTTEDIRESLLLNDKSVYRVYNANDSVFPKYWYKNSQKVEIPFELQDTSFWRGNASDVCRNINNGVSFALHRDHGWEYCWPYINFSTTDIDSLHNEGKMPVVFCIDCQCGQFNHTTDCFSESFLKKDQGGCVGILAATGVTFSLQNNKMAKNIVNAIWPISNNTQPLYRLGEILKYGLYNIFTISSREYYECFGDPSMRLYSSSPIPFNEIDIKRTSDSIIVSTDDANSQIAFYKKSTGVIKTFFGASAKCNLTGDDVSVCISAPNRKTFLENPTDTLYIQNETISGTKVYRAKKFFIGSNVTNDKPYGPVTFSGNKATLISKEVEITGNTSISLGTEFEIRNQ